jgi:cytochrome c oxidase subunit 4
MAGHGKRQIVAYLGVFAALLVLLAVTVAAGQARLGAWAAVVAITIATVKALLVAVWFMHLKDSSRLTWLFAAAGVMWLAIMLGLTMGDTVARM